MTFLEKFRADHPEMEDADAILGFCPEDLNYEQNRTGCKGLPAGGAEECRACWNREMPETRAAGGVGPYAENGGAGDGG
jgi:hypothetical protein